MRSPLFFSEAEIAVLGVMLIVVEIVVLQSVTNHMNFFADAAPPVSQRLSK